jgi:hypothetical protein
MSAKSTWIRGIKDIDLDKILLKHAKTNPGAAPSATAGRKKKSSGGVIFLRPICQNPPCPGGSPTNPDDPCGGRNWVWQPDIAVQLNEDQCPSEADQARIINGLAPNLCSLNFPNPDIRLRCANGKILILIWSTKVDPDSCYDLARKRAQVPDLVAGGNFGIYLNSSFISTLANQAFQEAEAIKSYDEAGNPSINGPIYISGLSFAFKSPHTIETYISGSDHSAWPPAGFTLTIVDLLEQLLQCNTSTHLFSDVGADVFAILFAAIETVGFPLLLPLSGFLIINDLSLIGSNQNPQTGGGVGSRILQVLPPEIPLPQRDSLVAGTSGGFRPAASRINTTIREKLVIAYGQPTVDDTGLYVGGLASLQPRIPSAQIVGPSSLIIVSNASQTFADYTVAPQDFFGKLNLRWSGGAQSPTQWQTRIIFQRGNAKIGQSFSRTISVQVIDQEGSSVTVSLSVSILVVDAKSVPVKCQYKPWLPECNPSA